MGAIDVAVINCSGMERASGGRAGTPFVGAGGDEALVSRSGYPDCDGNGEGTTRCGEWEADHVGGWWWRVEGGGGEVGVKGGGGKILKEAWHI